MLPCRVEEPTQKKRRIVEPLFKPVNALEENKKHNLIKTMAFDTTCKTLFNNIVKTARDPTARLYVSTKGQRTPGWFAARKSLVTMSVIAGLLGENPYQDAAKSLLDKLEDRFQGNRLTRHGTLFEPVIQAQFAYLLQILDDHLNGNEPDQKNNFTEEERTSIRARICGENIADWKSVTAAFPSLDNIEACPSLYEIINSLRQFADYAQGRRKSVPTPSPAIAIILALLADKDVQESGLTLSHDYPFLGASPDGVLFSRQDPSKSPQALVEWKSPFFQLYKKFPSYYYHQCQFSMLVFNVPFILFGWGCPYKTQFLVLARDPEFITPRLSRLEHIFISKLIPNLALQQHNQALDVDMEYDGWVGDVESLLISTFAKE